MGGMIPYKPQTTSVLFHGAHMAFPISHPAFHGKLQRYVRPLAREIPRYQRASVFLLVGGFNPSEKY